MSEERSRILTMLAEGKITAAEAESLLDALDSRSHGEAAGDAASASAAAARGGTWQEMAGKMPRYLFVKVVSTNGDNVDVRVPLNLVRSGLKLTSLIPPHVMDQINESMAQAGMSFDLADFKAEDIEELLTALRDMEINVDSKNGDNVRVYCG